MHRDNAQGDTSEALGGFHCNFGIHSKETYVAILTVCIKVSSFQTQAKTVWVLIVSFPFCFANIGPCWKQRDGPGLESISINWRMDKLVTQVNILWCQASLVHWIKTWKEGNRWVYFIWQWKSLKDVAEWSVWSRLKSNESIWNLLQTPEGLKVKSSVWLWCKIWWFV